MGGSMSMSGNVIGKKPENMKKVLISLCIFATISFTTNNYCDGWEDGYCEGYRDVEGQFAICPIPPTCPIPELECGRGYRCGYNRGFKKGMRDAYNNR